MEKQEIFKAICEYMDYAGEDFCEHFADDYINVECWAFFLLGKGYTDFAKGIISVTKDYVWSKDKYIYVGKRYEVYKERNSGTFIQENQDKNIMLMAEFISLVPHYLEIFKQFNTRWRLDMDSEDLDILIIGQEDEAED